ncbi:MAG: class I SAM-dependent methyltransferase [Sulfurimicrobium sp.]|nr:class I SAM-dependent methyltransferase [Sulfurimicrobium sp.]MDP1703918.1 class I SAM-dependent methyltransferase [Sulfurimicrobium sp.]MDP2198537.1 class I SAM-dependent methyltransferase [Sulfurimicrobium sp.]MDP3689172.1 class I SAM-dependent methyltransferase [Sulfurimicrobium sp.]
MKDLWNERFGGAEYFYGTEPNAFLVSQAPLLQPGQSVLSVADGEGRNGVWLAEQGLNVLAVDFSEKALEKSRRLAASRGVSLQTELVDVHTWNWGENRFDVIVAIFIQFASSGERPALHRAILQALKPGGLLLLQGYTPKQLEYKTGGPSNIDNLYTAEDLQRDFGAMEILQLREHDMEIKEGPGHCGMSALVELVARKVA